MAKVYSTWVLFLPSALLSCCNRDVNICKYGKTSQVGVFPEALFDDDDYLGFIQKLSSKLSRALNKLNKIRIKEWSVQGLNRI